MFLEQMISQCLWRASSWKNLAADRSYREQYSHTEWGTGLGIRNVNTHAVTPHALVKSFLPPLLQCCVCAGTRCLHSTNTASPTVTENSTGFRLWSWWRVQEGPFFLLLFCASFLAPFCHLESNPDLNYICKFKHLHIFTAIKYLPCIQWYLLSCFLFIAI